MVELIENLAKSFGDALLAGFYLTIAFIVPLVIGVIVHIIWLVNKHDQHKHQMDIETLGLQGDELLAKKAQIRSEQLTKLKKRTQKRRKILIVVTLIVLVGIFVGIIGGMVRKRLRYSDINLAEVGSRVLFGHYKGANGWIVLDKKDDKLLILSEYVICLKKFNEEKEDVTWSTCSLRKWMNTEYLTQAFSEEELERIADTSVYTEPSEWYESPGGEYTIDKVFLLSIEEAKKYFSTNEERMTTTTKGKKCWWWLRSPCDHCTAGYVYYDGTINDAGRYVNAEDFSVRPAMWIELNTK